MMEGIETFFQLCRSKGSNPFARANSEKNALRFSTSIQNSFGLVGCVDDLFGRARRKEVGANFSQKGKEVVTFKRKLFCEFRKGR